jgi:predicted helicase
VNIRAHRDSKKDVAERERVHPSCLHGKEAYVMNGKPALEWVMERQGVKTDKDRGIVNDANRYAVETTGDPRYPFDPFCRVITVSLETIKIVRSLPALDID